ncbi:hypothetical protein GCM10023085_27120 [Actinomadura viridis]
MRTVPPTWSSTRRTLKIAALTTGVLTATLVSAPPTYADPCGGRGDGFDCSRSTPGGSNGGGGSPTTGGGGGGGPIPTPTRTGEDGGGFEVEIDDPPNPAPPATIDLAQRARDSAQLPTPTVHTSPEGKTYVRVRTALWVEGFVTVQTEPITVGGQTIQATATPKSVTWSLGETTLSCNSAGSANDTTCGHSYQRSSSGQPGGAYQITATINWGLTWTCTGAECDSASGTLEDLSMTSPPTPLVVDEIQTNTRP